MLISVAILIAAIVIAFGIFEKRKPKVREMVMVAMMSAIAVVANIMCAYTVPIHAGTAVVIITGIALGSEAGMLTGAFSRFICNFFMGQGVWTPWEMAAWAIIGMLAGVFFCKAEYTGYLDDKKLIKKEQAKAGITQMLIPIVIVLVSELVGYIQYLITAKNGETYFGWRLYAFGVAGIIIAAFAIRKKLSVNVVTTVIYTFLSVFVIYGGIMNIAAMFMSSSYSSEGMQISLESLKLLYITGVPYDAFHALGASVCVFLFGDSMIQKMNRVRIKYGLFNAGKDK